MKYAQEKLTLVLCAVTGVCLSFSTGCDDRPAKLAEARYFQQQKQILERQNAEWERQLESLEAQDKKYEALLAKWEEHTKRVAALLDRWDRLLGVLEERSGDQ